MSGKPVSATFHHKTRHFVPARRAPVQAGPNGRGWLVRFPDCSMKGRSMEALFICF